MSDETAVFNMPEIAKAEHCDALASFLMSATDKTVEINCAAVRRMHSLAVQAIVIAQGFGQPNHRHVQITAPSEAVVKTFDLLGFPNAITRGDAAE